MNLQKIVLLSALALTVVALSELSADPAAPAPPPSPAPPAVATPPPDAPAPAAPLAQIQDGSLAVARNGPDVLISWILPAGEFRQVEIYRNTNPLPAGRGRAATARLDTPFFIDRVPDLTVTYYYWLKLVGADNTVRNLGPVPTPSPIVWQP